jgi:phosphinothricin acetyltransferase
LEVVFEDLALEHGEDVVRILNHYIRETTSAYREGEVGDDWFREFLNDGERYCGFAVKTGQGATIGFCTLEPYMPLTTFSETADTMYFIDPAHTGLGAGSKILDKMEEEARKRGISKLVVDISAENAQSIRFHEKHGFAQCGMLRDVGKKFGRTFSLVLMEKTVCDE